MGFLYSFFIKKYKVKAYIQYNVPSGEKVTIENIVTNKTKHNKGLFVTTSSKNLIKIIKFLKIVFIINPGRI